MRTQPACPGRAAGAAWSCSTRARSSRQHEGAASEPHARRTLRAHSERIHTRPHDTGRRPRGGACSQGRSCRAAAPPQKALLQGNACRSTGSRPHRCPPVARRSTPKCAAETQARRGGRNRRARRVQVPGPGRWQVPGARLCGLTRGARLEAGWGAPESADCRQGALLPARRVLHGPTQRFRKRENARLASVRECDAFFLVKRSSCDDFLCVDATHHQMEQVEAPWAGRERGRLQRWGGRAHQRRGGGAGSPGKGPRSERGPADEMGGAQVSCRADTH